MAIASSTSSRRQCSSHGAGQTRPSTDGNGIVRLKIRVLSRQFALGVGLEEARDVDVARALVLARRQAVRVVVARRSARGSSGAAGGPPRSGSGPSSPSRTSASTRSADAPRPRPRRRTSGTRRSPAAWARSTGSGSRSRCRGRPRGWSGPRSPRRRGRRPRCGCAASTAAAAATACRAGARRANPRASAGLGRGRRGGLGSDAQGVGHRAASVDAGVGTAGRVEVGPEVSHPAGQREGRQALVVAQRGGDDVGGEVGRRAASSTGRSRPSSRRATISARRFVPIRHGIDLPHASFEQNRVSTPTSSSRSVRSSTSDDRARAEMGAGRAQRARSRRACRARRAAGARRTARRSARP